MTNMTYPSGAQLAYQYDAMGRLNQMRSPNYPNSQQGYTATATATYKSASQLSTLAYGGGTYGPQFTDSRTYNTLMQLTQLTNAGVNMQYIYPAGQNNGRVSQTIDGVLNETVNYTYDMWNRLTAAAATNGAWGESYTFDNFGNLTGKTPTVGTAPALSVSANPATNQQSGLAYDANGNSLGATYYPNVWDVENRLINTQTTANQPTTYSYDPSGRRVWKELAGVGTDPNGNPNPATYEIYFYGATGQKLETDSGFYWSGPYSSLEGINIYFGGKLLQSKGVWVATDRLGSVRANSNGEAMSYWPFGEERTKTANGREKFATYTRDAVGQDYAEQRYYNSNMGAFWSPDPGGLRNANPMNPSTWNGYAYVMGDPINRTDRRGLCSDQDNPPCFGTTVTEEAPPDPLDDDDGSGGPSTSGGSEDGDYGGEEYIPSIATAGQAKQGLIQAFQTYTNCAKILGGTASVDAYVNKMTFEDGTQPGSMGMAGSGSTQTFQSFNSQYPSTFAATLTNAQGNMSSTVVLFADFFGNVAGGNPTPLAEQEQVLIHEFMHSELNLGHDALVKKFGIKVTKGQSASQALDQWIANDCKNN